MIFMRRKSADGNYPTLQELALWGVFRNPRGFWGGWGPGIVKGGRYLRALGYLQRKLVLKIQGLY